MKLSHRDVGGVPVAVVEVDGEVDLETGPELSRHILGAEDNGDGGATPPSVIVDLTEVDFFDSTGLRVLDEARAALEAAGRRLALVGVAPRVRKLFEITGLHDFAMYPSVDDAVTAVAAAGVDDES